MANDYKRGIRIYLETSDYGKGIDAMVAATQKYEKQLEDLRDEAQKMTASGQAQGKAWNDLQKQIKRTEDQLKKSQVAEADYRAKLQQTEKVLNNLSGVSYNELVAVQKQLQKELKDTTRGTDLHATKLEQLERVNKEVAKAQGEMNSNLGKSGSFFSRAADGFNRYFNLIVSFIAGITGVSLAFRKLAEDVAKMDDVYSDVMKTTGLTRNEVLLLNEELKQIDTRTAREQLNELARDAGKLGITGTQNILDFVDAGNQINVALGEDLGEDAIKNVGKMVGVFENSTKQLQDVGLKEQMLAVGSAINELGASSTASEPYLVAFAGRLGGVSKQAGIAMGDILGFASALDQDMQAVEMSATALQTFIMKLMADPAKFAKLAGLEVKGFNKLLQTDTNEAIKQVLRAMNDKGGFQAMIPIFKDMGLDGARAVGVLSSMAGSIEKIDEAQRVANQAMWEGTSITDEYAIKNNNLAAQLDKAKKAFQEKALELGEKLNPILLKSVNGTTNLIKVLVTLPKWLNENKGLIITLAAVTAIYTIAVNKARIANLAATAAEKLKLFWTKASTAAQYLQIAAIGYFTGATRAANLATKQFWLTLGLNPYVAIGVAIAAVVIGLYKLITGTSKVSAAQKVLAETTKEVNAQVEQETINLEVYKKRLAETQPNSEERIRLVRQLKEEYPGLLDGIDAESASVTVLNSKIKEYIKNLYDTIRLKVLYSKISDKMSQLEDEKDYTKRTGLNSEIDALKKQYEFQMLVVQYGEENAKLVAKQGELEKNLSVLRVQNELYTYESFSAMWKSQNERRNVLFSSAKAEQDALNAAYNEYKGKQASVDADIKKSEADLKKINDIISGNAKAENSNSKNKPDNNYIPTDSADKKTDPFKIALDAREKEYKNWQLRLNELRRTEQISQEIYNEAIIGAELNFLNDKKKLEQKFKKESIDTDLQISATRLKMQKQSDDVIIKAIQDQQSAGLVAIKSLEDSSLLALKDSLSKKLITQDAYDLELIIKAKESAKARLDLELSILEALKAAEFQSAETEKKAIDDQIKSIEEAQAALAAAGVDFDAALFAKNEKDKSDRLKKHQDFMNEVVQIFSNGYSEIGNVLNAFSDLQFKLKEGDLKNWKDWSNAISGIVQGALAVATRVNDEYWQYKANALEADKQRELSIAGESAEGREAVTRKYAEKELDLKKKQSSADTVLKIAQAVSAGALAVMQAYAQLGPIGGTIAAVLLGGITGLQIASIVEQNSAIQATTLDSSYSGGGSSMGSGARIAVPQAAEGRWDVIGEDDGRIYRNVPYRGVARTGIVTTPTLVGEVGDEAIIDNPTLRNIRMNAPWVLSTIQRLRVPQRAAGNYSEISESNSTGYMSAVQNAVVESNIEVMKELIILLRLLQTEGLDANVYIDKLERKIELRNKSLRKGSL